MQTMIRLDCRDGRHAAWSEGHNQALANIAWPDERKTNPYVIGSGEHTYEEQRRLRDLWLKGPQQ